MTAVANSETEALADPSVKRWLPWLVAVALFMENLDATIVNTAVPTIATSLGVVPLSLKAVMASYTLSLAVFIPTSGWMADRYGTRRVFIAAIVVFLLGSIGCGLAMNLPLLVAARIVQGIGGAMMTPVARLSLVRTFPRAEMLSAMNYVTIPALMGPLFGPSLGGLIVHFSHWRAIFFVNVPIALLGLWLARGHMPDYREHEVPKLDWRGFFLFGSGVAMLSYLLEVFGEHTLGAIWIAALAIGSAVLLTLYFFHARRVAHPLLALRLLEVRTFRTSVIGGFVTRLGFGGMPFLLPLLYQIGLGYPAWQAGLLTVPTAIAAILTKPIARRVLERVGYRAVLVGNTILLGAAIATFALVGASTPVIAILALSFAQGTFSSLQFTSINTLVFADVTDRDASKGSSISSTAQQMSLSFGVAFASLVAEVFLRHVDQHDPTQVIPALHHAFLAMGVLTIASTVVFRGLKRDDGDNVSRHRSAARAEVDD